jgi:ABC-type sugar transport system substrate-binding protein
MKRVFLAAATLLILLPAPAHSFRVAVFTPTTEGNTYWPEVHAVMRGAAASLQLEVTFHEFDVSDRFAKAEEGVQILRTDPVPDAAIFSVAFGQAEPLMNAAEALGIPFFLNGPLFPEELATLGGSPRREYQNWIGYFHEDEEEKGYLLARELIAAARAIGRVASDGTVQVVGVGGDATWHGSVLREAGLRRAVAEDPAARLLQTVPTRWTPEEGREMTTRLLARYPEVTVVWAASDQLALGAAEGLRSLGMEPGQAAFTGGLDLSLVGLEAVRDGTLTATVAATALIWAEILVCLHHYLQGEDFADRFGTEIHFPPEIATYATAEDNIRLRAQYEAIDYTEFVPCSREDDPVEGLLLEEGR